MCMCNFGISCNIIQCHTYLCVFQWVFVYLTLACDTVIVMAWHVFWVGRIARLLSGSGEFLLYCGGCACSCNLEFLQCLTILNMFLLFFCFRLSYSAYFKLSLLVTTIVLRRFTLLGVWPGELASHLRNLQRLSCFSAKPRRQISPLFLIYFSFGVYRVVVVGGAGGGGVGQLVLNSTQHLLSVSLSLWLRSLTIQRGEWRLWRQESNFQIDRDAFKCTSFKNWWSEYSVTDKQHSTKNISVSFGHLTSNLCIN